MPQRGERTGTAAAPQELAAVAEVRRPGRGSSGQQGRGPHAWPWEVVAHAALPVSPHLPPSATVQTFREWLLQPGTSECPGRSASHSSVCVPGHLQSAAPEGMNAETDRV